MAYKRKFNKGDLTMLILNILEDITLTATEIIDLFLSGHRQLLTERGRQKYRKRSKRQQNIIESNFEKLREKQRIYNVLYRLKQEGFINDNKTDNENPLLKITFKGKGKLQLLKNRQNIPNARYAKRKETTSTPTIIIFDISEKHKAVRNWLRKSLTYLGFVMLQKSVWIGDNKLPKDFLDDLKQLNLLPDSVKIFSINKTGSVFE